MKHFCKPQKVGIEPLKLYRMLHLRKELPGKGSPEAINQTEKLMATNQRKPPFVGAVVILHLGDNDNIQNNTAKECPAIITRVWSTDPPYTVNLKGIPDGPGTIWRTSVMHQNPYDGVVNAQNPGWRWPDEELQRGSAPMVAQD